MSRFVCLKLEPWLMEWTCVLYSSTHPWTIKKNVPTSKLPSGCCLLLWPEFAMFAIWIYSATNIAIRSAESDTIIDSALISNTLRTIKINVTKQKLWWWHCSDRRMWNCVVQNSLYLHNILYVMWSLPAIKRCPMSTQIPTRRSW